MNLANLDQGTIEWLLARVGRVTASRICDVMSYLSRGPKKGGESASRYNYKIELAAGRITGLPQEDFDSPDMRWGREQERFARAFYETKFEVMADQVGFIVHPDMPFAGASPDSLVGDDGGLEIKCPRTTTHFKWWYQYIKHGIVPEEHQEQCLFNMDCEEREWWDFMSYDPRVKRPELMGLVARMYRDEKRIKEIRAEVRKFNQEIIDLINSLPAAA